MYFLSNSLCIVANLSWVQSSLVYQVIARLKNSRELNGYISLVIFSRIVTGNIAADNAGLEMAYTRCDFYRHIGLPALLTMVVFWRRHGVGIDVCHAALSDRLLEMLEGINIPVKGKNITTGTGCKTKPF
jgi:hypothetical protein